MKTWCYWNLHKNCVSFKRGSSGRVSHANSIVLQDVDFHVLRRGREKVIKERKKNVHSFVRGTPVQFDPLSDNWKQAYYNPYVTETWQDKETGNELNSASFAFIKDKQVWYIP